jgi:serine/threonine protein kinase
MSENETITHEELVKQIEEGYKERERLFRNAEQMTEQITMKVRIVDEEARKLFPELARDLEVNGLINDVCIDEDEFIHDGLKRVRLLGLEQIKALGKLKIVPRDSKCENIPLTKEARMQHLKWSYEYFLQNAKFGDKVKIADILAKRYGIHRVTVYRWIKNNFTESTQVRKPRRNKCDACQYKNEVFELKNKINELNSQLMKLKSESKEQLKEEISNSQYEVEQILALFLKKHPNKELTQLGSFQDKLTV